MAGPGSVNRMNNTTIDVAIGATLEFDNRLGLGDNTLTKTGGTLDIQTDPGFTPNVGAQPGFNGDTFAVLTASPVTGKLPTSVATTWEGAISIRCNTTPRTLRWPS